MQSSVEIVDCAQMIIVGKRDHCKLVERLSTCRIQGPGKVIISFRRAPVSSFLVQLRLTISGEITKVNEGRMT